jgi:hypothetical protein
VFLRGKRGRNPRAGVVHVLGVRAQAEGGGRRVGLWQAGRSGLRRQRRHTEGWRCQRAGGGGGGGDAVAGAGDARADRTGGAAVVDVEAAAVDEPEQEPEQDHPGQAAAEPAGAQGAQGGVGGHAVEEGHHPRGEVQDPGGEGRRGQRHRGPRRRELPAVELLGVELVRHAPAARHPRPRLAFLTLYIPVHPRGMRACVDTGEKCSPV